jgi:hypothetical protein
MTPQIPPFLSRALRCAPCHRCYSHRSLAPKRYPFLNASEHTERGVTLVSTTDDFLRGLSGAAAERFRSAFRRDP